MLNDDKSIENEDDIKYEYRIKKPNSTADSRVASRIVKCFAPSIKVPANNNSTTFWTNTELSKASPKQQSLEKLNPWPSTSKIEENDFTFEEQEKESSLSPDKAFNLVENNVQSQNSTDTDKINMKDSGNDTDKIPKENTVNQSKNPICFTQAVKLSSIWKLSFSLNENLMFDAADSSDEEPVPEGRPNDLVLEDSINLDTVRGEVEIYDKENSDIKRKDNSFTKSKSKEYFTIKPATELSRMISLPNNNEHVNISDMLSRSFAVNECSERYDDNIQVPQSLNQSLNLTSFVPESLTKNYSMSNLCLDFSNKYT